MTRIGEPWQRCRKKSAGEEKLIAERLALLDRDFQKVLGIKKTKGDTMTPTTLRHQILTLERENGELVKDKETLTCALEYAKADCAAKDKEIARLKKRKALR